jgi:hypothetical protein
MPAVLLSLLAVPALPARAGGVAQAPYTVTVSPVSLTMDQNSWADPAYLVSISATPAPIPVHLTYSTSADAGGGFDDTDISTGQSTHLHLGVPGGSVMDTFPLTVIATTQDPLFGFVIYQATATVTINIAPDSTCGGVTYNPNVVMNPYYEPNVQDPWRCWEPGDTGGSYQYPTMSQAETYNASWSVLIQGGIGYADQQWLAQPVVVPGGNPTLTVHYWPFGGFPELSGCNNQQIQIRSTPWPGSILATVLNVSSNAQSWQALSVDMTRYAGERVRLYFLANSGCQAHLGMYLDDITLE